MGYEYVDENSKPPEGQKCWATPAPDGEPCWGELKFIEWEGHPGDDDWQVWGCRGHANYPEGPYIPEEATDNPRSDEDIRDEEARAEAEPWDAGF